MEGRGKKAVTVIFGGKKLLIFENRKNFGLLIEKLISLSGELM